jgi:predicted ester cyclase
MDLKPGREGVKDLLGVYLGAFDPMTVEVHHLYEDAGTVIAHVTFHGTHSGAFAGVPPTGKQVRVEAIDITRCDGDRMVEHWGQMDTLGLLTQIGAIPSPG